MNKIFDDGHIIIKRDTTVCFSAVVFPQDYDWIKDPYYGLADFSLVLYKNGEAAMSMDSRSGLVSANPDTHHILGSNLYTEYNKEGETLICRNGELILVIKENGTLKGLYEEGEVLYTLFQEKYNNSISLRKGEEILFRAEDGEAFGALSDPSYFPTGALYKDGGQICFCYRSNKDGLCYKVIDARAEKAVTAVGSRNILDMKVINGGDRYAYDRYGNNYLKEARIWRGLTDTRICGILQSASKDTGTPVILLNETEGLYEKICNFDGLIYLSGRHSLVVSERDESGLKIFSSLKNSLSDYAGSMIMNPSCVSFVEEGLYLAISPASTGEPAYIYADGRRKDVDIHGFISSIGVSISLPR